MKRIISLVLIMSLLLVGCKQDVPKLIKPVNSSSVYYTVSKDTIKNKVVYDGVVTPKTSVEFAKASGTAYVVNFKPGDTVNEGDVLYSINEGIDEEILSLKADIEQFEAISEYYTKLNEKEIAEMKRILAGKSGMDRELYALDIELREFEQSIEEEERAEELLKKKEYYDELILKQQYSDITAPCTGTIVYMGVFTEGDYIEEEDFACVIAKENEKYFEFKNVKQAPLEEADTISIQFGSQTIDNPEFISFTSDEIKDNSFSTNSVYMKVSEELLDKVELGQYCALTITYNTVENVLNVPNECINNSSADGSKYCLVLNETGKEERVSVEIGAVTDFYTEIKSGLSEGQQVYYGTDTANWNNELETYEVKLGSFTHTTTYSSIMKNAQYSEVFTVGYPGKINQIFLTDTNNVSVTEGQELFTVIGEIEESVYEKAKLDYENAQNSYDSSIESYDEMIESKEEIMDNNATDSIEYIIAEYELEKLENEREAYIEELDKNLEFLSEQFSLYESARNGEEITIKAPVTGTLDMTYTLITNAEVGVDTEYCVVSQSNSFVATVLDSTEDEDSLLSFGNEVIISSKNPITGETLLVGTKAVTTANTMQQFDNFVTLQINSSDDGKNIFVNTATASFNDIEIDNVCVITTQFFGFEGTGDARKTYVNVQTENGVVKKYVELELPSDSSGNVWVKNGLEPGDIIVK